jgi:hypothetical protein
LGFHPADFFYSNFIIPVYLDIGGYFTNILVDVVSKGVVVIDHDYGKVFYIVHQARNNSISSNYLSISPKQGNPTKGII